MAISKRKSRKAKELDARRRAEIIFKVRGGLMTVVEAASELGVSRKTYYQWEEKAVDSMIDALTEKEPGRPALPPQVEENRRLREFLEFQRERLEEFGHRERLIKEACKLKIQLEGGRAEKKCGHCDNS